MTTKANTAPLGVLTAEQNALFYGKIADLERRVTRDGSVAFPYAMAALQQIAENRYVPPADFISDLIEVDLSSFPEDCIQGLRHSKILGDREGADLLNLEYPNLDYGSRKFVALRVADLGYKKGGQWTAAFRAGLRYGFEYCPIIAGPAIAESYQKQPLGERLIFAMESFSIRGVDTVYILEHTNWGRRLQLQSTPMNRERGASETSAVDHLRGDDTLVFMRRET